MHPIARSRLQHVIHRIACLLLVCSLLIVPTPVQASTMPERAAQSQQGDESEWLIMIYSAADDNILEEDMMIDLQEAELVGSSDSVKIVAQTDRFRGGYSGMGNWTSTKRLLITQDDDMGEFASEELEDLGEVNMADGETLREFIEWAVTEFPAQKRALIMSNHGAGWPGGWTDPNPGSSGEHELALVEAFGDSLWLMEMGEALEEARANLGIEALDLIGFDACLMAQLEVFSAMAPHARYSVASEELEPGLGWAYAAFLERLTDDPSMDGGGLATAIVETYIDDDLRLLDRDYVGSLTPTQAAAEIFPETTLSAIDLGAIGGVTEALDGFIAAMMLQDQEQIARSRTYAQSYESVFGDDSPSPYIDLGHFSQLVLQNTNDADVQAAYEALEEARAAAVIAERHGEDRAGSTGIAIYFPVLEMYEYADNWGYNEVAVQFTDESQWDEFLAFHHGYGDAPTISRPLPPLQAAMQALMPDLDVEYLRILEDEIERLMEEEYSAEEIAEALVDEWELEEDVVEALLEEGWLDAETALSDSGPVNSAQRKPLQISPIALSAEVAYVGEPVTVEAEISGDRVGFVYSFVGRWLPDEEVLIIEDQDYIFADDDLEVGGVVYPEWPDGTFTASFDWEPYVYAMSDGESSVRTFFAPETYGEEPTYSADGIWHFADGSPDRYARITFSEGEAAKIFGFMGTDLSGTGTPWEITPAEGDQFTVLEHGYYTAEDAEEDYYTGEAGTLTYYGEPFYIETTHAPSGFYMVGIEAEDYDGNWVESYEGIFAVGEDEVTEEGFVPLVDEEMGFAMLYPEAWALEEQGEGQVVLVTEDEEARMFVEVYEFPDAADGDEANQWALDEVMAQLESDESLEALEVVGEPAAYMLGAYDALMVDLAYTHEGTPYAVEVVAATPTEGVTYLIYFEAPADQAETLLPDLDAVLYNFDILLSGIDRADSGAAQPEFAEVYYEDDFSDSESGLYDEQEPQDWGQGYYDAEGEEYIFALEAGSGAIYDYYADGAVDEPFMVEVATYSAGSVDTGFGLIFQVQDEANFYAFRISGDGYFMAEKAVDGTLETLIEWTPVDEIDLAEEAVNTIAVAGETGYYALFVNGVQVGEFEDEDYSEGTIGFIAENYDEDAPTAIVFDDLVVGVVEWE